MEPYRHDQNDPNSLNAGAVESIYEDRDSLLPLHAVGLERGVNDGVSGHLQARRVEGTLQ